MPVTLPALGTFVHLGAWFLQGRKHVPRQARSPAGPPGRSLEAAVTDRLYQCWTRGLLACPYEARAKHLAVIVHFRDPSRTPSYT